MSLPLIRAVGPDASAGVGSAVALLDSAEAAILTAERLGEGQTAEGVEAAVSVERRQENAGLVTVTARSPDAVQAATIANEFVRAALDARASELRVLADEQIERSQDLIDEASTSSFVATEALRSRIADLEQILDSGDPTLSVAREAAVPDAPDGAPAPAVLLVSLIGGLGLACLTVVLLDVLGPAKISDEESLLETYALPIIVRLPALPPAGQAKAGGPRRALMRDAHRSLRSQLEIQLEGRPRRQNGSGPRTTRAVAITSPSRGDGSSFVVSQLAQAIVRAGESCSIVDLDLSTRGVEAFLGVADEPRVAAPMVGGSASGFARSPVRSASGLELLTVVGDESSMEASLTRADDLVELARSSSDWTVVDTPAVAGAATTLPALKAVDAVLIVVRLRRTDRGDLIRMREILELAGLEPMGYVVVSRGRSGLLRDRASARLRRRTRVPSPER